MAAKKHVRRARRKHHSIGAVAPRRRSASRKKPDIMGTLVSIALGAAGAYAVNLALQNETITKAMPSATTRGALAVGAGALGAIMVPALAPVFIGAGIVGAGTAIQSLMAPPAPTRTTATTQRMPNTAVNAVTPAQLEDLKQRVRQAQFRLNGVPRGVMTGVPRGVMTGNGNIPQGVIVGNFDPNAPSVYRPY